MRQPHGSMKRASYITERMRSALFASVMSLARIMARTTSCDDASVAKRSFLGGVRTTVGFKRLEESNEKVGSDVLVSAPVAAAIAVLRRPGNRGAVCLVAKE